jgi:CheY-like chemotaxis protein
VPVEGLSTPFAQSMQIQTVQTRIIVQTATAVAVPLVALIARWALGEGVGKYSSLWIALVGSVLVAGLGWLTRGALIEYDKTPTDDLSETYLVALDKATKSLAVAEGKSKDLEAQNQRLQDRSLSLEMRVRELETPAVPEELPKPAGIIDGLRTVIDVAGERATTTLTGGSQLEVGLALSKEEVEGVQSMLDSIGRKLARPQVEEFIEATAGDNLPRILLVEDDLTSRRLIRALLPKDLKAVILEAEDGQFALQMMEKPPYPDVIICDVLMPNMDGLEFLTRLRDLPRFSNTPVVMISANAFKENVAKAASLKVNRFLRKPLERKDLGDAIEAALKEATTKDSSLFKAQQRLCLDDKAYFELSAGFSRAIGESVTFVRSSISRDRWQAATIRINALNGSIQMVGDERLSVAINRVEKQLRNTDVNGVTIELEMLEQENERFMRTLVHSFNALDLAGTDEKTEAK